jgi:DNA primase
VSRVDLVLAALRIEVAKRRGTRAWTLCPFHNDTTPTSFFVRTSGRRTGQSHCFSCGGGGSLVDLVMRVRNVAREDAVTFLEKLGKDYEPPRFRARVVEREPQLGRARFKMPREVIFEPLEDWVTPARDYAINRCRLTADEVELFQIGYAVDGLKLASRIVLPWLGPGLVVGGYSARTYVDAEPKYVTPSEAEKPERATMFGEHLWPSAGRERVGGVIAVTEGALNALSVRRATGLPVAAIGGSEVDGMQVAKLATFARVLVLTDPDAAGEKAALAMARMLSRYIDVRRVAIPSGKDALDIERESGLEELRRLVERAAS